MSHLISLHGFFQSFTLHYYCFANCFHSEQQLGSKKNNAVKVTQNIENLEALRKREKKWRKYLNVILSLSPFTLTEVDMNLTNQTGFLTVVRSALSFRLCTLNQYSLGKQQILFSRQFCFSESLSVIPQVMYP